MLLNVNYLDVDALLARILHYFILEGVIDASCLK